MELWPLPEIVIGSAVLQLIICAVVFFVNKFEIIVESPQRIERDVDDMRGRLIDEKIELLEHFMNAALAIDSADHTSNVSENNSTRMQFSGKNLTYLCGGFIKKWSGISESERQITAAHRSYDQWRYKLWYWFLGALALIFTTFVWPEHGTIFFLIGVGLLGSQIVVIYYIQRKANFLIEEKKKTKYVKHNN